MNEIPGSQTQPRPVYNEQEMLLRLARAENFLEEAQQELSSKAVSQVGTGAGDYNILPADDTRAAARQKLVAALRMLLEYMPAVQDELHRLTHNVIEIRVSRAGIYNDEPRALLADTETTAQRELDRVVELYNRLLQLVKRLRELLRQIEGQDFGIPIPVTGPAGSVAGGGPFGPPDIPDLGGLATVPGAAPPTSAPFVGSPRFPSS